MPANEMWTHWYDGELMTGSLLSLPLHDPALLYGASVFTTLRVYEHCLTHPLTAWQAHRDRTQRSLQAFGWAAPDWQALQQGAATLAKTYPVLRVTVFPDGRGLILGRSLPPYLTTLQTEGAVTWVADFPDYSRSLTGHKTGNYLGCWMALQAAQRVGAQEAILVNHHGHWLETSTGNLWGWADGHWWTPPLAAGILPGVMRSRLIQGLKVQEQIVAVLPWETEKVSQFTFLAYTNSVLEVVPIRRVLQAGSSVNYNPDHTKNRAAECCLAVITPNFYRMLWVSDQTRF